MSVPGGDLLREAADLLDAAGARDDDVPLTDAATMRRAAGDLRDVAAAVGRPEILAVAAALDDDDRELHRILDGMGVEALAGLRRALTTVATYAANTEGRRRAAERRRGWR